LRGNERERDRKEKALIRKRERNTQIERQGERKINIETDIAKKREKRREIEKDGEI
jgi:hypothetical protein